MVSDTLDLDLLHQNAVLVLPAALDRGRVAVACRRSRLPLGFPLQRLGIELPCRLAAGGGRDTGRAEHPVHIFLPHGGSRRHPTWLKAHVWIQITVDLAVLTAAIHFMGSVETPAVFMYLFHIILACIFFPPWQSLLVVATSASLYLACLALEASDWIPPATVLLRGRLADRSEWSGGVWFAYLGFTFSIWTRDLVSRVAAGRALPSARSPPGQCQRAVAGEHRGTHAAHAADDPSTQGPFCRDPRQRPAPAARNVRSSSKCGARGGGRVAARCAMLSRQVIEMLQLANLRSTGQTTPTLVELEVAAIIQASLARFEAAASQRNIRLHADLQPCVVHAAEDHLKMLVDNLLSNAIHYSYDGGTVHVSCGALADGTVRVEVCDSGIGIPADKLPKIFDDYYRTGEAARHNKESTGLGLAIVRHVTRLAGIRVHVESSPGRGSRFTLTIPPQPLAAARKTASFRGAQDLYPNQPRHPGIRPRVTLSTGRR